MDMIPLSFFDREPHQVARQLLGMQLVRHTSRGFCVCRVVEVEVYGGVEDQSSHADGGRPTKKNASMFLAAGTVYVYSIHTHHCLNVVTPATPDKPSAILIRAAEPLDGLELMASRRGVDLESRHALKKLLSGPGKLCQALDINKASDGQSFDEQSLYFAWGQPLSDDEIVCAPRVGLNPKTCGDSVHFPWRYAQDQSMYLSRKI